MTSTRSGNPVERRALDRVAQPEVLVITLGQFGPATVAGNWMTLSSVIRRIDADTMIARVLGGSSYPR